jgi:hypothetical protein
MQPLALLRECVRARPALVSRRAALRQVRSRIPTRLGDLKRRLDRGDTSIGKVAVFKDGSATFYDDGSGETLPVSAWRAKDP